MNIASGRIDTGFIFAISGNRDRTSENVYAHQASESINLKSVESMLSLLSHVLSKHIGQLFNVLVVLSSIAVALYAPLLRKRRCWTLQRPSSVQVSPNYSQIITFGVILIYIGFASGQADEWFANSIP